MKESEVKKNLTQQRSSPDNTTGIKLADAHATKNQMSVDKSRSSSRKAKEDAASVAISLEKGERRARVEAELAMEVGKASWLAGPVRWLTALASSEQRYWRRC